MHPRRREGEGCVYLCHKLKHQSRYFLSPPSRGWSARGCGFRAWQLKSSPVDISLTAWNSWTADYSVAAGLTQGIAVVFVSDERDPDERRVEWRTDYSFVFARFCRWLLPALVVLTKPVVRSYGSIGSRVRAARRGQRVRSNRFDG